MSIFILLPNSTLLFKSTAFLRKAYILFLSLLVEKEMREEYKGMNSFNKHFSEYMFKGSWQRALENKDCVLHR